MLYAHGLNSTSDNTCTWFQSNCRKKKTRKHLANLVLGELMNVCEISRAHGGDFSNMLPSSLTAR